jgi:hypothetical protein
MNEAAALPPAANFDIGQMELIERRDYIVDCNWKV